MSVGGSTNFGKSEGSQKDPTALILAHLAQNYFAETSPLRDKLQGMMMDVMGGKSSGIPMIASAMNNSRVAGSQALAQTQERLAQTGQAGTPFGSRTLAQATQSANQAPQDTKNALVQSIFNLVEPYSLGSAQSAFTGLQGATGANISGTSGTIGQSVGGGFNYKK